MYGLKTGIEESSHMTERNKMYIEHIAMYVNDIEKTKDFFVQYFDAAANDGYHNDVTGFRSYF